MSSPAPVTLASTALGAIQRVEVGHVGYAEGYATQLVHHAEVLAARDSDRNSNAVGPSRPLARLLVVEHDPVLTVTRKARQSGHVLASAERLEELGIELHETDRGGDVTYHGPGQLVVYPIVDLQRLGVRLHGYMRLLEQAVIDGLAGFGLQGERDADATGVWLRRKPTGEAAKVCAMGVPIRAA